MSSPEGSTRAVPSEGVTTVESPPPEPRLFSDGRKSFSRHAVEITPGNYHGYRYRRNEDGSDYWTASMQPLDWESWKAWQDSLRDPVMGEAPAEVDLSHIEQRLDDHEAILNGLSAKLDSIDRKLGELAKLDAMLDKLGKLDAETKRRHEEIMAELKRLREAIDASRSKEPDPKDPKDPTPKDPKDPKGKEPDPTDPKDPEDPKDPKTKEPDPKDPKEKDPAAEIVAARPALEKAATNAANRLALVKNKLEGRMLIPLAFGRERQDRAEYKAAREAYDKALAELLKNHREAMEKEGKLSPAEIESALSVLVIKSDIGLAEAQKTINDQKLKEATEAKGIRGKFRRFIKKWAEMPAWKKIPLALLVGLGVGVASGGIGAGIFGLAAVSSYKFSIGLLNKEASAINNFERVHSRKLQKLKDQLAEIEGGGSLGGGSGSFTESWLKARHDKTIDREKRNRKLRNTIFGLGAVAVPGTVAAMHFANILHIPNFRPWEWFKDGIGPFFHPDGGEFSGLHNDTIHARTPSEFVRGAFELMERQGYDVSGLSQDKIDSLARQMMDGHWQIASGMESNGAGGLRQHLVDVARDWADGYTENYQASGDQAFRSADELRRFARLAEQNGISITKRG